MEDINELLKRKQLEEQINLLMKQILTPEARQRLNNIKLVKPDFANQVELYLIQLYQSGMVQGKINDEKLKEILIKLQKR